ncbi:MAG: SIR2 family protein, partial [bacterium]|nr:SIR2 family protein [bacterium]
MKLDSNALSRPMATLDDILQIPGNQEAYNRLKEVLAEGSAMAFIGAGASYPLFPLWPQLIAELAEEPVKQDSATAADKEHWLRTAGQRPLQVASQIHAKLGDAFYHTFLYETFKDRVGDDRRGDTPAHGALLRMNLKALATTNYDGGLMEARRVLRPDIRGTGFTIWNNNWEINRWASGDIFTDGAECPVLFAHGHFANPAGIVLDRDSYRRAYHSTPYRRLFENLWLQERLIFVGFSFQDAVLSGIADEVLYQTTRQQGGPPRHIAILALPDDHQYSPGMRETYRDEYNAEPLFYPTTAGNHAALQVLLESLTTDVARALVPAESLVLAPTLVSTLVSRFAHETTEDENF